MKIRQFLEKVSGKIGLTMFIAGMIYVAVAGRNHLNALLPAIITTVGFLTWHISERNRNRKIREQRRMLEERFITDKDRAVWKKKRIIGGCVFLLYSALSVECAVYNMSFSFFAGCATIGAFLLCFPKTELVALCSATSTIGGFWAFIIMFEGNTHNYSIPLIFAFGGFLALFLLPFVAHFLFDDLQGRDCCE